jgi:hypothetical protein
MIKILPFDEPNIIGFRLGGQIDDAGYDQAVAEIQQALDNNNKIRIYAEVEKFGGMTPEKFFENFKVKFGFFKELNKFEKEAIVSNKQWLASMTKLSDRLFPSVEVRYFPFEDKDEALTWIKN